MQESFTLVNSFILKNLTKALTLCFYTSLSLHFQFKMEENLLDTKLKRQHTETTVTNSPLSTTTTTTTAMTSVEYPLKKQKLNDSPPPQPPPETTAPFLQTLTPPPLSQDEILAKRRNKDTIRNLYEGYKRIKRCLFQKQVPSISDLDQNFLALIASSRGNRFSSFLYAVCVVKLK